MPSISQVKLFTLETISVNKMSVRPLEINDPPIQRDNDQQIIDDLFSENQNNDSLNSLNYNQDNEDKQGNYIFTDIENKLVDPYNNGQNIDSSIDYHNIEQSQNLKSKNQIINYFKNIFKRSDKNNFSLGLL